MVGTVGVVHVYSRAGPLLAPAQHGLELFFQAVPAQLRTLKRQGYRCPKLAVLTRARHHSPYRLAVERPGVNGQVRPRTKTTEQRRALGQARAQAVYCHQLESARVVYQVPAVGLAAFDNGASQVVAFLFVVALGLYARGGLAQGIAYALAHFTGGLARESYRHHGLRAGSCCQQSQHTAHQQLGLTRAGRRLHYKARRGVKRPSAFSRVGGRRLCHRSSAHSSSSPSSTSSTCPSKIRHRGWR